MNFLLFVACLAFGQACPTLDSHIVMRPTLNVVGTPTTATPVKTFVVGSVEPAIVPQTFAAPPFDPMGTPSTWVFRNGSDAVVKEVRLVKSFYGTENPRLAKNLLAGYDGGVVKPGETAVFGMGRVGGCGLYRAFIAFETPLPHHDYDITSVEVVNLAVCSPEGRTYTFPGVKDPTPLDRSASN